METGEIDSDWKRFCEYRDQVDLKRIRLSSVPPEFLESVRAYHCALNEQLADPENESWDSLDVNAVHNALLAVKTKLTRSNIEAIRCNCPRCSGLGYIAAYRHIHGGRCLACNGSRNIETAPECSTQYSDSRMPAAF